MGLTVSHDAFDGPYPAFSRWRKALAITAGKPPLILMEGFFEANEIPTDPLYSLALSAGLYKGWGDAQFVADELYAGLPIKWEALAPDDLNILLMHSDCDGQIEPYKLEPMAGRLEYLAGSMPRSLCVRELSFEETTLKFARGCRAAAKAGEPLLFR